MTTIKRLFFFISLLITIPGARNVTFAVISSLPIILQGVNNLTPILDTQIKRARFVLATRYFLFFSIFIFAYQAIFSLRLAVHLSEETYYPKNAISYLSSNPTDGNLFNAFNWGGYLIYAYPAKKIFIDGRMLSWVNNHSTLNESRYATKEYVSLIQGKASFREASEKYFIDTVLIPNKKYESFEKLLSNLGWVAVYQDNLSIIYRK